MSQREVEVFWEDARIKAKLNRFAVYVGPTVTDTMPPPAWQFGATAEQADELLALVLSGSKRASASALWDFEAEDEDLPVVGALSIVLDGRGHPRALLATTAVEVVPFDQVDAEHARAEGEGDGSLAHWRAVHREFFTAHAAHDRGFAPDMPVVLERFEVLHTNG